MKLLLLSLLLLAFSGSALCAQTSEPERLTPEQVMQNTERFHILDVRSSEEYAEGHVPGALNIPHNSIHTEKSSLPQDKTAPVVLYCRSGRRAGLAASELKGMGYENLFLMQGDMPGWTEKGFNVAHD